MSALVWVHEDAISTDHPVFANAGTAAEMVFIWDPAYFQSQGYSRKRLVFIYECLQDLDCSLYYGDTVSILSKLADQKPIFTAETPNPEFQQVITALRDRGHSCHIISDKPFATVPANVDLKRFFRFWNKARKSAMTPSYAMKDAAE